MSARMATIALAAALLSGGALSQEIDGKQLFPRHCAMCHNATGMGTGLLGRRMKPEVAELEKREDLSAAYVERFARVGVLNMPPVGSQRRANANTRMSRMPVHHPGRA